MEDLRVEIWDYLYRVEAARSIDEIAQSVDRDAETVRAAIEHNWFDVVEDKVMIAYGAT